MILIPLYSPNYLAAAIAATLPVALYISSIIVKREYCMPISCVFIVTECFINSMRRGGGDLIHYVDAAYSGFTFWEPLYGLIGVIGNFLLPNSPEALLSTCLFLVSALFYIPFLFLTDQSRSIMKYLAFSALFFGPSLPETQLRLCTSISFGWISYILIARGSTIPSFLFALASLTSHSLGLLILPLILFSNKLTFFSLVKLINSFKVNWKTLSVVMSITLILTVLASSLLSSRYQSLNVMDVNAVASSSFIKNLIMTGICLALLNLRTKPDFKAEAKPKINSHDFPSGQLSINNVLQILIPFGWLSRLRFILYTSFTAIICDNHSKTILTLVIVALSARNLYLYFAIDQSCLLFT